MPSLSQTPSDRVYRDICSSYHATGEPPTLREVAARLDRHKTTVKVHCENLRARGLLAGDGSKHRSLIPNGPDAQFARFSGEVLSLIALGHPIDEIAASFGVLPSLIRSVKRLSVRTMSELPA